MLEGSDDSSQARTETLYVSDLDGTLLNSQGFLSEYSRRTLNELVERDGLLFTYATARSFSSAKKVTDGLRLALPAVVYGGAMAVAVETGEIDWANMINRTSVAHVLDEYERRRASPLVYWMSGQQDQVSWIKGSETSGTRGYLSSRGADPRFLPVASWSEVDLDQVFYITLIGDLDEVAPLADDFRSSLSGSLHIVQQQDTYRPEETWLELTDVRANKAASVQRILGRVGASRLVSFGDNQNDIPLARVADLSLAVANATQDFRSAASSTIESNDDDGVARWLAQNRDGRL